MSKIVFSPRPKGACVAFSMSSFTWFAGTGKERVPTSEISILGRGSSFNPCTKKLPGRWTLDKVLPFLLGYGKGLFFYRRDQS